MNKEHDHAMNAKEFFDTVSRMREKQKAYFHTRSNRALTESRELERIVDGEIARVKKIIQEWQNPTLW